MIPSHDTATPYAGSVPELIKGMVLNFSLGLPENYHYHRPRQFFHQSPFPSLNLSNRRTNLSRALSPEHAHESAGFC
jgi:hypothetical protein